jgi:peptidoglycan/xylan/chitin deacetylase (PgdA/CDA1 family)
VDTREELDADAITSERLVALLEFLRGNSWTTISLDDVDQAAKLNRPLPDRAVLITIDDGYRSVYTRVFPLLLAYRMPAVVAVVGSWMNDPAVSPERYISWDQAREMQRSGLVEFASHTYDLHRGTLGNPQGNELPAAAFSRYDPILGYEDKIQYRVRIREDLAKSVAQMKRELGKSPRALVWPYGRYTTAATDIAREEGFTFALTLDSEPADASKPMELARYLLSQNFDFKNFANNPRSLDAPPTVQRLVQLDPFALWTVDARETDARLGRAIERVRTLGATSIVIDAAVLGSDGTLKATWFPNKYLPMRADLFSRLAWQMHTRAGVKVFARLPVNAALNSLKDVDRVLALFGDFGSAAPIDGFILEDVPQLAAMKAESGSEEESAWEIRRRRDAVEYSGLNSSDALALRCFRILEAARPRLSLALLSNSQTLARPSSIADITLISASDNLKESARLLDRLKKQSGATRLFPRRFGVWIEGSKAPSSSDLISVARMFQRNGMSVIGWSDDMAGNSPLATVVAGSLSARSFPGKF